MHKRFEYGKCYSAGHRHRDEEGYGVCDYVGRYWAVSNEAECYEGARMMAGVTGSIGATYKIIDTDDIEYSYTYDRPKHAMRKAA